jgi:hypothetical protein
MDLIKKEASRTPQVPAGRIVSVLLVDEDANDLASLIFLFQREGYAVRACDTTRTLYRDWDLAGTTRSPAKPILSLSLKTRL